MPKHMPGQPHFPPRHMCPQTGSNKLLLLALKAAPSLLLPSVAEGAYILASLLSAFGKHQRPACVELLTVASQGGHTTPNTVMHWLTQALGALCTDAGLVARVVKQSGAALLEALALVLDVVPQPQVLTVWSVPVLTLAVEALRTRTPLAAKQTLTATTAASLIGQLSPAQLYSAVALPWTHPHLQHM